MLSIANWVWQKSHRRSSVQRCFAKLARDKNFDAYSRERVDRAKRREKIERGSALKCNGTCQQGRHCDCVPDFEKLAAQDDADTSTMMEAIFFFILVCIGLACIYMFFEQV